MGDGRLKLALIPYLNCEPFYAGIGELGFEIVHEPPRLIGERAARGEVLCGPMSVVDVWRVREVFEPLADFGIACEGPAYSVLLFSRREIDSLAGLPIGLTAESSTSVRLLQLLLVKRYGVQPLRLSRAGGADVAGRLLIGDDALRAAGAGLDGFPFVYDLGQEWFGWQAVPFVFARWVISRGVPATERERIAASLESALASWPERVPEIAARRGRDLGLGVEEIREYLSTFSYRLGPAEEYGERAFRELLADSEIADERRPASPL
jgi:chorismate dehydratase